MAVSIGDGRAHFWTEHHLHFFAQCPKAISQTQYKPGKKSVSELCVKRLTFPGFLCIIFFDQIFWCNRSRAKLIIKFASLLLKIKFNTKKTGGSKCFAVFIDRFNMPANRIFTFIDTEDCLKALSPAVPRRGSLPKPLQRKGFRVC